MHINFATNETETERDANNDNYIFVHTLVRLSWWSYLLNDLALHTYEKQALRLGLIQYSYKETQRKVNTTVTGVFAVTLMLM